MAVGIEIVGGVRINLVMKEMIKVRPVQTMELHGLNPLHRLASPYGSHSRRTIYHAKKYVVIDGDQT